MAGLMLRNIYKKYPDGTSAANNFTMEIPDGEFTVVLGPAGSGKSTLLKIIAGLETATYGELHMDGKRINEIPARDREVALVYGGMALYPHLNVAENLAFALRLRKFSREEAMERVEEAAELLGLTDVLDRMPAALTGAQRQRVAIGRALVRKPKVYLFDEIFAGLDLKLRETMKNELKNLQKQLRATFIYASAEPEEALPICSRAIIIKDGYLQQAAPVQEIKTHPSNLFVAEFTADGGMNAVEAEPVKKGDKYALRFAEGAEIELPASLGENEKLRKFADKKLVAGIRPRDVKVSAAQFEGGFAMEAETVEFMGTYLSIHLIAEGLKLDARVPVTGANIKTGDRVYVSADAGKILLFDADTGKALRL